MPIPSRSLVLFGVLASALAAGAQPAPAPSAPQVPTMAGLVEGKDAGPVQAFLGIPYALPPVGDLRWKPPVPAAKWEGVRKATEFGPRCMQGRVFDDMVFHDPGGSEDCLSLNVWIPKAAGIAYAAKLRGER